jgi:hypothetical protein
MCFIFAETKFEMKLLSIIALTFILFACSSNEDKIAGKWRLEKIDYSEHFEGVEEDVREMLKGKMEEEFERLKGKTFFVFGEDKSLELQAPNYIGKITSDKGKWKLNEAKDSVFFEIGIPESYQIVSLVGKDLILKTDEMPRRTLFLKKVD